MRTPKPFADVSQDSHFSYQMGRLVGAAEMASQLLQTQDNPDIKTIGNNLAKVVDWFFMPEKASAK